MDKQPELSVADFFAFGNAAAAQTAALDPARSEPVEAEWEEIAD